jgi:glycosyltransferase involved in cell wall biosynthesis
MKILHISYSDNSGGAAKAAMRLCLAQWKAGMDVTMLVVNKTTDYPFVKQVKEGWGGISKILKDFCVARLLQRQESDNRIHHSLNLFSGAALSQINAMDADIVNLHWVNNEMISVEQIARINKPIVWTLQDTWAFCGAEHYPADLEDKRFSQGYTAANNRNRKRDLDRWTWNRKMKHWKDVPFTVAAPSKWMKKCVEESVLFRNRPVVHTSNPIDLDIFRPIDKKIARDILKLDQDKKYILFGADGATRQPIKGFDLLVAALPTLAGSLDPAEHKLLIFGAYGPTRKEEYGFEVSYAGRINDEITMALTYAAADCMVVPSRQDNLPQTALEAIGCGTPVVAFNVGGLPDIIDHMKYGYLAQPYDPADLAAGISWVLTHPDPEALSQQARAAAESRFSDEVCVERYKGLYITVINNIHR